MSMIDDGGAAFPQDERYDSGELIRQHTGMTLRDHFAGQALAGMLPSRSLSALNHRDQARTAYQYADAMLAARKEPTNG